MADDICADNKEWLMAKIFRSDKALVVVAWVVAIALLFYYGLLIYYSWMPTSHWFNYLGVEPIKQEFKVNEKLKFRSHTDLHTNIIMTFNDILFCRDQVGDFERYSSQNTQRLHTVVAGQEFDRFTVWPYSPGVAYPTECYLESNIKIHLPLNVNRTQRYDGYLEGKTFRIVE